MYASQGLERLINLEILTRQIDVVQIEYTALAQYGLAMRRIPYILFEHDVYPNPSVARFRA